MFAGRILLSPTWLTVSVRSCNFFADIRTFSTLLIANGRRGLVVNRNRVPCKRHKRGIYCFIIDIYCPWVLCGFTYGSETWSELFISLRSPVTLYIAMLMLIKLSPLCLDLSLSLSLSFNPIKLLGVPISALARTNSTHNSRAWGFLFVISCVCRCEIGTN